ncbi:MAG: hypothetical protein K9M44_02265 [Candidatus Pacebacteria bacterium]|nr:hypothetical protein [Candidatus Paceibacterota bacterium]
MKTFKKSLSLLVFSFLAWFLSVRSVLADLVPAPNIRYNINEPDKPITDNPSINEPIVYNSSSTKESVDYTLAQHMMMNMEWYHYVIIGVCLVVIIVGGLISISKAKARKEKKSEDNSDYKV